MSRMSISTSVQLDQVTEQGAAEPVDHLRDGQFDVEDRRVTWARIRKRDVEPLAEPRACEEILVEPEERPSSVLLATEPKQDLRCPPVIERDRQPAFYPPEAQFAPFLIILIIWTWGAAYRRHGPPMLIDNAKFLSTCKPDASNLSVGFDSDSMVVTSTEFPDGLTFTLQRGLEV